MIIGRYILKNLWGPFQFGMALFSGVLLLDKIFELLDLLINRGANVSTTLKIFALFLPTVITLAAPMATLLACLITFGGLSENNEILALRASGFSWARIFGPPLAAAAFLSLLLLPFNTRLAPKAFRSFRNLFHTLVTAEPLKIFEPRHLLIVQNMRVYAEDTAANGQLLKRVWILQSQPPALQRIVAEQGVARLDRNQLHLRLENGQMQRWTEQAPGDIHIAHFDTYTLNLDLPQKPRERSLSWREFSMKDLRRDISRRRKEELPVGEPLAEYYLRFAVSFAPLSFALLGLPLGNVLQKSGRGVGFGAAAGVIFFYYLFLILGMNLAEREAGPAWLLLWLGNGFTAGVGLILLLRQRFR